MNVSKVKELCEKDGISQNELARRVGVSTGTMSNFMSGKREPRADVFKAICKVLGRKAEELW